MAIKRKLVEPRGFYFLKYDYEGETIVEPLANHTETEALDAEEDFAYSMLEHGINPPDIRVYQMVDGKEVEVNSPI